MRPRSLGAASGASPPPRRCPHQGLKFSANPARNSSAFDVSPPITVSAFSGSCRYCGTVACAGRQHRRVQRNYVPPGRQPVGTRVGRTSQSNGCEHGHLRLVIGGPCAVQVRRGHGRSRSRLHRRGPFAGGAGRSERLFQRLRTVPWPALWFRRAARITQQQSAPDGLGRIPRRGRLAGRTRRRRCLAGQACS